MVTYITRECCCPGSPAQQSKCKYIHHLRFGSPHPAIWIKRKGGATAAVKQKSRVPRSAIVPKRDKCNSPVCPRLLLLLSTHMEVTFLQHFSRPFLVPPEKVVISISLRLNCTPKRDEWKALRIPIWKEDGGQDKTPKTYQYTSRGSLVLVADAAPPLSITHHGRCTKIEHVSSGVALNYHNCDCWLIVGTNCENINSYSIHQFMDRVTHN